MDRVYKAAETLLLLVPALMLAIFMMLDTVQAGTVLLPMPPARDPNSREEIYSESRFGQPPARATSGRIETYTPTEVDEIDRAPAGLGLRAQDASDMIRTSSAKVDVPIDLERAAALRRKGVQEVAVIASDLGYFPKTVFVTRDIPVRLFVTGASKSSLCIMMDSFQVRKQVRSQKIEEITFTPSTPGKYRFYCPVNGMEGTLVVKELVSEFNVANRED